MDIMLGLMCAAVIWIFVKNFKELNDINNRNIKVKQPISVYQAPDADVFEYYFKETKKTPEEAWENIISLGSNCQTYEDFVNTKKIDYRLRGILIMLLMEHSSRKKEIANGDRKWIQD